MARIKIEDLPKDLKVSEEEMKGAMGGGTVSVLPRSYDLSKAGGMYYATIPPAQAIAAPSMAYAYPY